jgi:hypothetical protein
MSSEKSQKSMPSVEEINAYLEQSAARTRLRLPLAKGAAAVVVRGVGGAGDANNPTPSSTPNAAPRAGASRALPVQGAKTAAARSPSQGVGARKETARAIDAEAPLGADAEAPLGADAEAPVAEAPDAEAWHPFSTGGDE